MLHCHAYVGRCCRIIVIHGQTKAVSVFSSSDWLSKVSSLMGLWIVIMINVRPLRQRCQCWFVRVLGCVQGGSGLIITTRNHFTVIMFGKIISASGFLFFFLLMSFEWQCFESVAHVMPAGIFFHSPPSPPQARHCHIVITVVPSKKPKI